MRKFPLASNRTGTVLASLTAIVLVSLVVVGSVRLSTRAHAQATSVGPSGTHHVGIVASSDSGFDASLETYFPGVSSVPGFQAVKPLLAIINDDSAFSANAYLVRWTMIDAQGLKTVTDLSMMASDPRGALLSGERTELNAGEVRLISPFFSLSVRAVKGLLAGNGSGLNGMFVQFQTIGAKTLVAKVQGGSNVQTSLDGVIFVDGVFAGPNSSNLYERYESEQSGELDEAAWMLNLLQANETDQQIEDQLSQQIFAGTASAGVDLTSLHTAAIGRQAQRFLAVLNIVGQAGVKKIAQRIASARPVTLQGLSGS